MFTGLVQQLGTIINITPSGTNKTFTIQPNEMWKDIKIDESIAHNGICLTVVDYSHDTYQVTAIQETLNLTTSNDWVVGQKLNLERALMAHERLGGHLVQGHVDGLSTCINIENAEGSFFLTFQIEDEKAPLIVEKGSIAINGISLTIFNVTRNTFDVAIIPYTWEFTNLHHIKVGQSVNIEYDIIGKYMLRTVDLFTQKIS